MRRVVAVLAVVLAALVASSATSAGSTARPRVTFFGDSVAAALRYAGDPLGTLPVGLLSRTFGRRTAMQIGTTVGALSGLICCVAVLQNSFPLLLVGTFGCGFYAAGHMTYRLRTPRANPTSRLRSHTSWREVWSLG
jgi:MFS family permease